MKKFKDDDVIEIYCMRGTISDFKKQYSIDIRTVKNIKKRYTYQKVTEGLGDPGGIVIYKLSPNDVFDIRDSVESNISLAEYYGVHRETIHNVRHGKTRFFSPEF